MTQEFDITNKFFVSALKDNIVFPLLLPRSISRKDALILAAWIVAIADDDDEFNTILDLVKNT